MADHTEQTQSQPGTQPQPETKPKPEQGGFLAPAPASHPVGHCVRCGKETPAEVALCDEHNPTHIRGPSATQMHATVFGGIVLGLIGFFVVAGFAVGNTGPYEVTIVSSSTAPAGALALSFTVANVGENDGVADCRVTRDGIPRPDDLAFRSPRISAGQSVSIDKVAPGPPIDSVGYVPDAATVVCR